MARIDFSQVSIRNPRLGLTAEDVEELRVLNVGSLEDLMVRIDRTDGDLTQLTAGAIVIEKDQSEAIVAKVLAYLRRYAANHPAAKKLLDEFEQPAAAAPAPITPLATTAPPAVKKPVLKRTPAEIIAGLRKKP